MEPTDRPRLRPLETQTGRQNGQDGLVLWDPDGLFEGSVWVPQGLLPVVACFTGELTIHEIARELTLRYGRAVDAADVQRVADELDDRLCLEGARADQARAERAAAFARLETRPAAHAGSAGYPAERAPCAARLREIVGDRIESDARTLVGLIAPHIDLARGERGYRAAYRALASAPPSDLYVLFGTAHQGPGSTLIPTTKDYATPLGVVATDADFVRAVAARLGPDPFAEELLHASEHSLEFQVLFLQHCLQDRPFRIAPFLTGRLADDPGSCDRTAVIVDTMLRELARRGLSATFVGGADLAHLGPWFGDPEPVAPEVLAELEQRDRASLALLTDHRYDEFHADIEGDGNARRICGTTPMYLVARLGRALDQECRPELLDYGQAVAEDGSQVVSFASLAYRSA